TEAIPGVVPGKVVARDAALCGQTCAAVSGFDLRRPALGTRTEVSSSDGGVGGAVCLNEWRAEDGLAGEALGPGEREAGPVRPRLDGILDRSEGAITSNNNAEHVGAAVA